MDNCQPRIPRVPFLCGCCYNAPQYGGRGEDFEFYPNCPSTQHRQWEGELNIQHAPFESEVPAFATTCAAMESQGTSPGDIKSCVSEVLGEHTVLQKNEKVKQSKSLKKTKCV